ncbi:heavy metal translocating P-type ATPase [Nonlabens ponticola]|uniref:Heavy metal transporter n=1 Tax=Nonlabens ponticola TaxID=2496866 RepID=A0A3S9N087_9FLAO|nr:heavy metal-associated domain-containing protein [Nonlabens ponticola]AZQ44956.1 heavy metal transporter [Nonlabens ponticola]
MKHTYNIEGMTCTSCSAAVEKSLKKVAGIDEVSVDLENKQATVEMKQHVALSELRETLPSKYSISQVEETNNFNNTGATSTTMMSNNVEESKWQQLKPLFLILGYIAAATILLNYSRDNWNGAMLDFMGLFFIVFSFFKILDLQGFPESFKMYDPLAKIFPAYGWIYPFIETALGLMFLMRFEIDIALIITLVILGITTVGVTKTLLDKKSIQCACLGTALKLPMTQATFIENAIMIVMAVVMLFIL